MITNFSWKIVETRRQWSNFLRHCKIKVDLEFCTEKKVCFNKDRRCKTLKMRESITNKFAPQERLKEILYAEGR